MRISFQSAAAAALAIAVSGAARADVVTLNASKDATLFESATGAKANGGWNAFYVGRAGTMSTTPVRRGVIAFDVAAAVPAGATITNVVLTLYMSQTTSGAKTITLHELTTDWNEGTTTGQSGQGGNSQPGDVTWIHTYYASSFWNNAGGDYVAASSATKSVNGSGYYSWGSSAQMVADVQGWLDAPSSNFGWMLKGEEQVGQKSAKQFESRSSAGAFVPKLQVTFTAPPPVVYCTSKTNSQGCVPAIGFTGIPDANAGSGFDITLASAINNKSGLLFYGTSGPKASPFQGGLLCVMAPTRRTPIQSSGGNPPPDDCSGTFDIDFNVRIASGIDPTLVAGVTVWSQYWSRDPADPNTTHLSDALRFYVNP
jgi:hypothetical protein